MGTREENSRIAKARAHGMAELYKNHTLQEIGDMYSLSRERVRQILSTIGVSYQGSVRQKAIETRTKQKIKNKKEEINFSGIRVYGVKREELKKIPKDRLKEIKVAYRNLKGTARRLDMSFELNIIEFWQIWADSRKYNKHGQSSNSYRLIRINFNEGYTVKNLRVEKTGDAIRRMVIRRSENQGV